LPYKALSCSTACCKAISQVLETFKPNSCASFRISESM